MAIVLDSPVWGTGRDQRDERTHGLDDGQEAFRLRRALSQPIRRSSARTSLAGDRSFAKYATRSDVASRFAQVILTFALDAGGSNFGKSRSYLGRGGRI